MVESQLRIFMISDPCGHKLSLHVLWTLECQGKDAAMPENPLHKAGFSGRILSESQPKNSSFTLEYRRVDFLVE